MYFSAISSAQQTRTSRGEHPLKRALMDESESFSPRISFSSPFRANPQPIHVAVFQTFAFFNAYYLFVSVFFLFRYFYNKKTTCPFSRSGVVLNICFQLSGHNDRLEFGQKLKRSDLINTCGLLKRNHQPSFIYLGYCALEWPCQS